MKYSLGGVGFAGVLLFGFIGTFTGIAIFFTLAIVCCPLTIVGMLYSDYLYAKTDIPTWPDLRAHYEINPSTNQVIER